jgi:hypothetical protein
VLAESRSDLYQIIKPDVSFAAVECRFGDVRRDPTLLKKYIHSAVICACAAVSGARAPKPIFA